MKKQKKKKMGEKERINNIYPHVIAAAGRVLLALHNGIAEQQQSFVSIHKTRGLLLEVYPPRGFALFI